MLPILRLIALLGTLAWLIWQGIYLANLQPRQGWSFAYLVVIGLAVAAMMLVLLPSATKTLVRHKDQLLPLGLLVTTNALIAALVRIPALAAILTPGWPIKILALSLSISVTFVLQILLNVICAGWTTLLVIQVVGQDRVEPLKAWSGFPRWAWRTFVVLALGWGVVYAVLIAAIAAAPAFMILTAIGIVLGSLVWNLATYALLPATLAEGGSFRQGLRTGWQLGRRNLGCLWPVIVGQMVLLGWATLIYVSFSHSPRPGSVTHQTKWNWSANGFWIGGYEDSCRWHGELMKALEAEPVAIVTAFSSLLFAILAIAIKIEVTRVIFPPAPAQAELIEVEPEQGEPPLMTG